MKKFLWSGVIIFTALVSPHANATPTIFTHKGVQKGAMFAGCYHNPCTVAKVTNFKQLAKTNDSSMVELTLLGGSQKWDNKKIEWDKKTYKAYVTCSIKAPTVAIGNQVTIIPINKRTGVFGALYNEYELYMQTCHNFSGTEKQAAKKYGYNVYYSE